MKLIVGTQVRRTRRFSLIALGTALAAAAGLGLTGPAMASSLSPVAPRPSVTLPDPVAAARPPGLTDAGPLARGTRLTARLYLAGRDPAAEARFAARVSTPGSGGYGQFLSPSQFAARFGPTQAQAAAVIRWARTAGLPVTTVNQHYVAVRGTAATVAAALGTRLDRYRYDGRPAGFAAVGGVRVPYFLHRDVIAVLGLDTLSVSPVSAESTTGARPEAGSSPGCSTWWGQRVRRIPRAEGKTRADTAICGYTPQQLRSAYGVSARAGQGATIAVVLDGSLASMRADADRFFAAHHLAGFAAGQFRVALGPGFVTSCQGSSDLPEEPLDVETAHIIAPAARVVYVGVDCASFGTPAEEQDFLDAETRIVDRHLASVETDSASLTETVYSAAMRTAYSKVFEQGAAEGIGFNFDAGDGGDATPPTFPASDPWATGVGATDLEIGRAGHVAGELAWGDTGTLENKSGTGYTEPPPGTLFEGTTGGRSLDFAEPAYQRGVVPAALATAGGKKPAHRVLPDISAIGGATTGWLIGYSAGGRYRQVTEAGTSGSSPVIAALEADARRAAGHALGFANPLLYRLRRTAGIRDIRPPASPPLVLAPATDCFASTGVCLITAGRDGSLHVTRGFDDATGIGAATSQLVPAIRRRLA